MFISPEDEKYIAENPLGIILNPFRKEFEIFDEATYNENPNSPRILLTNRRALAALFADLTEYATKKVSQTSADQLLPGEFTSIHHSIWSHSHDPSRYYSLAAEILKSTSDLEAWKAILQFVEDYAAIPISLSSSCRKLSYESWREYIAALRIELKNNVHGELSGFWNQFFVGKPWEKRASHIYENLCKEHGGDALADFPKEPSKDTMWRWLDKFQKKYLDTKASLPKDEQNTSSDDFAQPSAWKYYRLDYEGEQLGDSKFWQLEVFTKPRSAPVDRVSKWRDVQVVGKITNLPIEDWQRQVFFATAVHVREIFCGQPLRKHAFVFILYQTKLQLWLFNRGGAFGSDTIDIKKEPERFIHAITAFTFMNDDELGRQGTFEMKAPIEEET
ncbi:BgTH12-05410 [Blumeria graminis f. sp. triticale]|uniref:BgtA-20912 n=3 Tax=Blumeria graminis TaxID=34373 RepID=A0A9X9QDC0_BLUGR|nr:hypothetical protein BGT96224_A20912 [Blumeria graminis f. sp. tritici 96224]CAD6502821.1 BgTH12-05410 [Blumeria graminis f. sp. triticale]VDB88318.1 BgtA-20912 [Blumeria graminis f. sp. tritici]